VLCKASMHVCYEPDDDKGLSGSSRQLRPSLFRHHVRGVPVGPVLVALSSGALLVLAVGGLGTSKRARQVAY
jgi:hypothetical protein